MGISVAVEPRCGPTSERPDLVLCVGGKTVLVDITVVHTKSRVPKPTQSGAWAAKAAVDKTVQYQLMLADKGPSTVFVPMAFESWGVFDSQVDDFLENLVATQDHTVRAWEIDRVDEMRVAIAVAIQEGNFLMWDNSRPLRGGRAPQSA